MTPRRTAHRVAVFALATIAGIAIYTSSASAQDPLARAKDLYLSASYDEALTVLDGLKATAPPPATEVAQYRVLCLLALNRSDDAKQAIESMVSLDPFYRPSDAQMSPRVRAVIEDTRKTLLPTLAQRSYAEAKGAFDRKDPQATKLFDRVLLLLDDPDMPSSPASTDLRTVAAGFRDLSKAIATAAAPPPPVPAAPTPAPAVVSQPAPASTAPAASTAQPPPPPKAAPAASSTAQSPARAVGDKVVPPATLSQTLPVWDPGHSADARRTFRGTLEITIDEQGNVSNAMVRQSTNPVYDAALLDAARTWRYKPATRNGVPISYTKTIEIQLNPTIR